MRLHFYFDVNKFFKRPSDIKETETIAIEDINNKIISVEKSKQILHGITKRRVKWNFQKK